MPPALAAFPLAPWERDGLAGALSQAGLPADDVTQPGLRFWRFSTDEGAPAGFGGLEGHGADALMRSILTLPPLRGRGVAQAIVSALEAEAMLAKCQTVWLLTTTAQPLFEKMGYAAVERDDVPEAIRATAQFASLCPDSAAVMMKRLA
jgi:N-acetylglutamate synthase-like GNAT family acetyltransferase